MRKLNGLRVIKDQFCFRLMRLPHEIISLSLELIISESKGFL